MIKLEDAITSSGKYPERAKSPELTDEVKKNLTELLNKVNALLADLKITNVKVSSGFRTSAVNAAIPNAAKRSLHMQGKAIDLVDLNGAIDAAIINRPDLLKKHGLWLEHPDDTKNWTHLDMGTRTDRPVRVFKP